MAEFTTILDRFEVMMRLGIHAHEAAPQRVEITVEMTVDYPQPLGEDAIGQVLDYDFIRDRILALAAEHRFALQETLCETVAALAIRDTRVVRVRVRSMKLDVYPDARVGCEIVRTRSS